MNILITGANSGFGRLILSNLVKQGHKVAGAIRDPKGRNATAAAEIRAQGGTVVEIDVTDDASVTAGVADAAKALSRIDVLINNAGVGVTGLQESFTPEDFRRLFDINLFGVQRMIRAVAPAMRERGEGLIIQISSLLGRVTMPFYGPYNASKWALEAMTETYRTELSAFGVEFSLVEPGGFPTGFAENLMRPSDRSRDAGYGEMAAAPDARLHHFMEFLKQNPQQNPQLVADAVSAVVSAKPGQRPFRVAVDKIGMGDAVVGYNDYLAKITAGIYGAMGMEGMLTPTIRNLAPSV